MGNTTVVIRSFEETRLRVTEFEESIVMVRPFEDTVIVVPGAGEEVEDGIYDFSYDTSYE